MKRNTKGGTYHFENRYIAYNFVCLYALKIESKEINILFSLSQIVFHVSFAAMWPLFSWPLWGTTWSTTPFTLSSTLSSWVTQTSKTSIRCHQNHCDRLRQPDHNLLSLSWVEHRIALLTFQNNQRIKYRNIAEIFQWKTLNIN